MDVALTQWINQFAGQASWLDGLMIFITKFGVPLMVLLVLFHWWAKNEREQNRQVALQAGISFVVGLAIAQVILLFVHRVRPYDAGISQLIIEKTPDWSFPSDHAIASTAIFATYLFNRLSKQAVLFGVCALIICFSRIFVGMHYASDVAGGAALAMFTAWVVKRLYPTGSKLDRWLVSWF